MLSDRKYSNAVRQGKFARIHAVSHVEEALEILTGMKARQLSIPEANTPKGSLNERVLKRLMEIAELSKAKQLT